MISKVKYNTPVKIEDTKSFNKQMICSEQFAAELEVSYQPDKEL